MEQTHRPTLEQLPQAVADLSQQVAGLEQLVRSYAQISPPAQDDLLNAKQAAAMLDVTLQTLYGYVHRRQIPYSKRTQGKRLYFLRSELLEWVQSGQTLPAVDDPKEKGGQL